MLRLLLDGKKGSSVVLIETTSHNILVDTSSASMRDLLILKLEENGFDAKDIDVIINTHLHSGHTGNNSIFPNATVYASPHEYVEKCRGCLLYSNEFKFTPVRELADDEIYIINTPGHTWGSVSVIHEKYVIVGDAIPNREALEKGRPEKCVDEIAAKSSLNRILKLGKNIITGHDGIIRADEI